MAIGKEKTLGRYIKPARNRLAETIPTPFMSRSIPFDLTT
jgi:hypothetical protein